MIRAVAPPYKLVKLSRRGELINVQFPDSQASLAQLPSTTEMEELFGHRDYLYFEAMLTDGILTLHKNVSPP